MDSTEVPPGYAAQNLITVVPMVTGVLYRVSFVPHADRMYEIHEVIQIL